MILFAWRGFPQYAARCVGAFVASTCEEVVVVATRPRVPVDGMEGVASCPVIWVDRNDFTRDLWREIKDSHKFPMKQVVLIVSGWGIPSFNNLAANVRLVGGRVFCMIDACFESFRVKMSPLCFFSGVSSLKQWVQACRYRVFLRRRYNGYFVPGKSGRRLMRLYGVPNNRITEGLYAADEKLFFNGSSIIERPRKIVYVGQFCSRKNVLLVINAFIRSKIGEQGWTLALYGCGPDRSKFPSNQSSIEVHDFLQPEELADVYRSARVFVLGSREEHWGVVVHEAALSGCVLLLSERVGAAEDFAGERNCFLFDPFSIGDIIRRFRALGKMSDDDFLCAQEESLVLAQQRGRQHFVDGVNRLLEMEK